MIDPYVYPGTDVLINHFDLRDEEKLGLIERMISVESILELSKAGSDDARFDLAHLIDVHRAIFEDVYPFAGQLRSIEVSKPESVLSGRSIRYGLPEEIERLAGKAAARLAAVDYSNMDGPRGWRLFTEALAELWRAHPFREGNTRTVLVFADHLLRAMDCPVDFTVISSSPSETRDELARATEGYGRGLCDLFKRARASHVRRDHPEFGFLTPDAARVIEDTLRHVEVPSRRSSPGEVLRGAVLCTSGSTVILQTSRGLVGVPVASFPEPPADGERAAAIVAMSDFDRALVNQADFDTARRFRNAMLSDPSRIEVPSDPSDMLFYTFDDPHLAALADDYPELLAETAEKVLRIADATAWSEWADRRYHAASGP